MSINIVIGIFCVLLFSVLLVALLRDLLVTVYQEGIARGRAEAEKAFVEYERGADEARQEIWRGEARQQ